MKHKTLLLPTLLVLGFSAGAVAGDQAEEIVEEKVIIALSTDDFELGETDLSHLAVGDAETIVTDSGKTIDLLRTEDGIEIYVDGELLDIGHGGHEEHRVVKKIEIICDDGEVDCEEMEWISETGDVDLSAHLEGGHKVIMIKGDDEEWDVETLSEGAHEAHGSVHIVKKIGDGADLDELHETGDHDVIIIRKKVEDEI